MDGEIRCAYAVRKLADSSGCCKRNAFLLNKVKIDEHDISSFYSNRIILFIEYGSVRGNIKIS